MRWHALALVGLVGCFAEPPPVEGGGSTGATSTSTTSSSSTTTGSVTATSSTTTSDESTTGEPETSDDVTEPMAWRQLITLDTAALEEPLYDVPVLVRLAPEVVDYASMAPDGSDVRFFDSDGRTPLAFEIEAWQLDAVTFVWVRLPEVGPNDDTIEIVLGYGDAKPVPAPPTTAVWSASYVAVWHLPSLIDSTGHGHDLGVFGTAPLPTQGLVGEALRFDDSTGHLETPDTPELTPDIYATIEALVFAVEHANAGSQHRVVVRKGESYQLATVHYVTQVPLFAVLMEGGFGAAGEAPDQLTDAWTMLVGTIDRNTGLATTVCLYSGLEGPFCDPGEPAPILTDPAGVQVGSEIAGADIDDVRISSVLRPASWLRLQQRSLDPSFAMFGDPVPQ